jgi:hypothetical protein
MMQVETRCPRKPASVAHPVKTLAAYVAGEDEPMRSRGCQGCQSVCIVATPLKWCASANFGPVFPS